MGIGKYWKVLMKYGYDVMLIDISDIALNKLKEFNNNMAMIDMREEYLLRMKSLMCYLLIFLSDSETRKLMAEMKNIKKDGLFIGSVNGMQGLSEINETVKEL